MSNNTLRLVNNPTALSNEECKTQLLQWATEHSILLSIFLDAFCIVDLNGDIIDCNVAFETLTEQSQRKIFKNPHFNFFLHSETTPQNWEKAFSQGLTRFRDDEVSASVKVKMQIEPKLKKLILSAVPIFSKEEQRLGTLVTIRDVTDESNVQTERINSINKSNTDGLTQLSNKSFTEAWLIKQLEVSRRSKGELSILMADVDHFKKVNDTYGHQAGDHVLRVVAKLLDEEIRKGDLAGRFGGEEFIVVMSNTNQVGALVVAERFRQRIQNTKVEFEGKVIPLTISLGTATFIKPEITAPWTGESAAHSLVSQCDLALYEAKHSGRNRTCQFETLPKTKETDPKDH